MTSSTTTPIVCESSKGWCEFSAHICCIINQALESIESTDLISLAAQFVNATNEHLFLTGKAGTGKTTFLRDLAQKTHKRFVVVAPTGIAALNAKGVTIHSQFLLPLGTFIPVDELEQPHGGVYTKSMLVRRHALNKQRKQVLRDIDLLIIDEVSMLRSDVLDAIDFRLKQAKRNFRVPFGGVQLLMIGDLFQLPPVVKDQERSLMNAHYTSAWFFHSNALQQAGFQFIELDKIFRQSDPRFISLLNNLRLDQVTDDDLQLLNSKYVPDQDRKSMKGVVTLCTHNRRADQLNAESLEEIDHEVHRFRAEVSDDFPSAMFPVEEEILLKVGAQVMFIKNDTEGRRYYNGKLAEVVGLSNDEIEVKTEEGDHITVDRHEWENKKYHIDETSKELQEEVIGTFRQYPLRLAWAITVHKSQGLTFDKAILDVSRAFAPGQVYVALSRLRSLDGLVLSSKIAPRAISTDRDVVSFSSQRPDADGLKQALELGRKNYLVALTQHTFDLQPLIQQVQTWGKKQKSNLEFADDSMRALRPALEEKWSAEVQNTTLFRQQLGRLIDQKDWESLMDRLMSGSNYYGEMLWAQSEKLLEHMAQVKQLTRTKTYLNFCDELDQLLFAKISALTEVVPVVRALTSDGTVDLTTVKESLRIKREAQIQKVLDSHDQHPTSPASRKSGRRKKSDTPKGEKLPKGHTYQKTLEQFKAGLSVDDIAEKRGLAVSTIESHLVRLIRSGDLDVSEVMKDGASKEIAKAWASQEYDSIGALYRHFGGKYSYAQLRMVQGIIKS